MDSEITNSEDDSMAKPMETSEEILSKPPISKPPMKRKANDLSRLDFADDIEDVGDGEIDESGEEQGGEGNDGEESDVSSREEGQEWDVDSFDDGFGYRPKRNLDPNDEAGQKMHRYRSQMHRSKGFNVDGKNYPGNVAYRPLCPINLDEPFLSTGLTGRAYMQTMVDLALERYNKVKGLSVRCEYIVRAITAMVSGLKSYITFMARESLDGELVEYQAKTEKRVWQKKSHVILCRPAPKTIEPMDDDWSYTDSSTDEEDSDASSRESDQEWDVDSFEEESDFKVPKKNTPWDEEIEHMRLYRPKMYKSKGFKVEGDCYPGELLYFFPVDLDKNLENTRLTGREYMQKMVDIALERYNKDNSPTVACEFIVRANLIRVTGYKSYITFMAREAPGGDLVEYQAKTEKKSWQRTTHAIFCRPSPK